MRTDKGFLVVVTCLLLLLSFVSNNSLAACSPPAKIVGSTYTPTSIQDAYDYASYDLGLSDFTLLLAEGIYTEDLTLDGGAAVLDGGYDCSFSTKTSTTGILGTVTIGTGAANFEGGVGVVSTDRCDFDTDGDGFTRVGSCAGSADDCNDFDPNVYAGALETCDGIDNNCNGQIDEGVTPTDADGDGYYGPNSCGGVIDDCDDNDATIHPGAVEIPYDGIDQDCNGADLTFAEENLCSLCHGSAAGWFYDHLGTSAPDETCASCHSAEVSNILSGHYGRVVSTPSNSNNMSAGEVIVCVSCHDAQVDDVPEHYVDANIVWAKVTAGVPPRTCDTCHEYRAIFHATATVHDNRVIESLCGNCHTSDTAILGSPGTGTLANDADVDTLHRSDCALCHNYTGTLLDAGTVRQAIQLGMNGSQISCLDCHTDKATNHGNFEHPVEVGPNDLSYEAPGILCSNCHVVANWAEIEGIEHNVATNGIGSCVTCHNSPRQEVRDAIDLGANPTHCLDCHADKELTAHGSPDHVADGYVVGGTAYCLNCHDPGSAPNSTVIGIHHNNCFLCHTTVPDLQPGIPAGGGDCTDCHTNSWEMTHTASPPDHSSLVQVATSGCGSCHSDSPLTDAADPKVHNGCSSCHDTEGGLIGLAVGQDFTTGGNCTTCHIDPFDSVHPDDIDHSALVKVETTSCGNCHSDPLPLVDPIDPKVHNSCFSCHDSEGGLINEAAGQSFNSPGNCITCHTDPFGTLHPASIDHSALIKVGTTSCGNCHNNPPPLVDPADPKVHNACLSCHDSEGGLINEAAGKAFSSPGDCTTCHIDSFDIIHPDDVDHNLAIQISLDCDACHAGSPPVIDPADSRVHNACITCHDTNGDLIGLASGNTAPNECTTCHGNDLGTLHPGSTATHEATPGSGNVLVFAEGQHDDAMIGNGTVYIACNNCHSTNLGNVHDNNCAGCHSGNPSPYDSLGGFWAGGCQQGGCHTTYHADASVSHGTVEDQCTTCHGGSFSDFPPLPSSCASCHTGYSSSDTIPPETTSDAQSSYTGAGHIEFSMTDNGKVGIGTFYSRIDGGAITTGSSILVDTVGSHSLEFWGVDQAGNVETTVHSVSFTVNADVMPPVTTSNAQPSYSNGGVITLNATDNGTEGVKSTYYRLNGGSTQTGTQIILPATSGTVAYTLEFWSEDWSGNVETHHTANFTVTSGTVTLRLVWSECDIYPENAPAAGDHAEWTVYRGGWAGPIVATGSGASPGWSGIDDVVVPYSTTPYYVRIDWYWAANDESDQTDHQAIDASTPGEIIRLPY